MVQDEKIGEDDQEQVNVSDSPTRAARILEQRMHKRHRQASTFKLVIYVIALIVVLLLIFLLRRGV